MNFKNYEEAIKILNIKEPSDEITSEHWKNFIKDKFININIDKLKNFRNNSLSLGLDNSTSFNKNDLNNKVDEFKTIIKKLDYKFENILKKFDQKNIGNNERYIKVDKYFIDYNQLNLALTYVLIEKNILNKNNTVNHVLEIGAGYGELSRMLLLDNNFKYFFVDLPENLLLQIYFLKENYPELNIYLNKGEKIHYEDLKNYNLFFFTPKQIHNIDDKINFDLIINKSSLMEMKKESVNQYFDFIQKKTNVDGQFININRYFKETEYGKFRFYELPYDSYWIENYSEPYYGFRRLHCLITKRIKNKNNGLNDTLNKIKKLSNSHEYPRFIPVWLMKIFRTLKFNF
tara:strand:- start:803 stop:1837 length:1035 start_codon:yes stop_codon:yes gene_type:complete